MRGKDVKVIHSCARAAGLDDETRRDVYERLTGARGLSEMTDAQVARVAAHLRSLAPARRARKASGKPHVRKVYALWWALADAGVVAQNEQKDRRAALNAFIMAPTFCAKWGEALTDVEFLSAARARDVVEALKDMARREGVELADDGRFESTQGMDRPSGGGSRAGGARPAGHGARRP